MYDYIRYDSPLGTLTIAAEDEAVTALVIDGQQYEDRHLTGEGEECETPVLHAARLWLDAYFAGKNPDVSAIPLSPKGTGLRSAAPSDTIRSPLSFHVTVSSVQMEI